MSQHPESDSRHRGACHCGELSFTFASPPSVTVYRCNCSICEMLGYLHLIVPQRAFSLQSGEPSIYTFNSGLAQHTFCSRCGIKPYYIPRSNPDGVSINFRCVDRETFTDVSIEDFDGQNWEQHADRLTHLSAD